MRTAVLGGILATMLALMAAVISLGGCALAPTLDAGLDAAEEASGTITERAISWICNRISVRQWRESFGASQERYMGWVTMCEPSGRLPLPTQPPDPSA